MPVCAINACPNGTRQPINNITMPHVTKLAFHGPTNASDAQLWAEALGRVGQQLTENQKICSNHFRQGRPLPQDMKPELYMDGYPNYCRTYADMKNLQLDCELAPSVCSSLARFVTKDTELQIKDVNTLGDGALSEIMKKMLPNEALPYYRIFVENVLPCVTQGVLAYFVNNCSLFYTPEQGLHCNPLVRKEDHEEKNLQVKDQKGENDHQDACGEQVTNVIEKKDVKDVNDKHMNEGEHMKEDINQNNEGNVIAKDGHVVYQVYHQTNNVMSRLFTYRKQGTFCDARFKVGRETFFAHSCILAVSSPYFASACSKNIAENQMTIFQVPESLTTDGEVFEVILDYMYTGNISISMLNVEQLLKLSEILDLSHVKECCENYLGTNLNDSNCLKVLTIASGFQCEKIVDDVGKVLKQMNITPDFMEDVSFDELKIILSSLNPNKDKALEYKKLDLLAKWTVVHVDKPTSHYTTLLSLVDHTILSDEERLDEIWKSKNVMVLFNTDDHGSSDAVQLSNSGDAQGIKIQRLEKVEVFQEQIAGPKLDVSKEGSSNAPSQGLQISEPVLLDEDIIPVKPKRFRGKRALTEKDLYCCSKCPKKFSTPSALKQHNKSHGGDYTYLCDICGFSTQFASSLSCHKKIHTGELHKCPVEKCNYETNRKSRLEAHRKKHSDVRDFVCSVCGKGFTAKRYLQRHELMHSKANAYRCHICDYSTHRSDMLNGHLKNNHGKAEPTCDQNMMSNDHDCMGVGNVGVKFDAFVESMSKSSFTPNEGPCQTQVPDTG